MGGLTGQSLARVNDPLNVESKTVQHYQTDALSIYAPPKQDAPAPVPPGVMATPAAPKLPDGQGSTGTPAQPASISDNSILGPLANDPNKTRSGVFD
jgi:hypothetical protein